MALSEHYEALYQLSKGLHHSDADHQLQQVLKQAADFAGATQGCIVTFDEKQEIATAHALRADSARQIWETFIQKGLAGFAMHSQRTVVIRDIANDPRWVQVDGMPKTGSAVALPFIDGERVFGLLILIHTQVDQFAAELVTLLEEVAALASSALPSNLAHQSARYTYYFREATVPLFMADMSGKLIDVNLEAVKLAKTNRADLIGQPLKDVFRTKATLLDDEHLTAIKNGEDVTIRTVIQQGDGEFMPVSVRGRQVEMNGKPVIEMFLYDITGETQLEQLRLDLAAMVYHDLRGPLQIITTSTQKLGQIFANHDNHLVLMLLQTGIRSTRQLRRMIDSLLDIQRLEQGNAIVDASPSDLRTVLGEAVQLIQPLATDAGMRLKFEFDENLPRVEIDDDMITRVVTNLLENAIKYTPDGGDIVLRAKQVDGGVRIGIQDSGPGIPVDMRTKIFDKYSRVKYRNVPKGIGLGLAFCRLAVEAHGGTIRVESDGKNGSEFVFTLPVKAVETPVGVGE